MALAAESINLLFPGSVSRMIDVGANITVRPVPKAADAPAAREGDFSSFVEAAATDGRPRRDVETKSAEREPPGELERKPQDATAAPGAAAVQALIDLAAAPPPIAQPALGAAAPAPPVPVAAPALGPLGPAPAAATVAAAAAVVTAMPQTSAAVAQAAGQPIRMGMEAGKAPSAASALATAGVTELSGESVVEAPGVARPADPPPPFPAQPEAAKPDPQAKDGSPAVTSADTKPDPAAVDPAGPDIDPDADAGEPTPVPAHVKPETTAASAPADRAQPMLQTASAPAASAGQNPQAAAGANAAVAAQVAVQVATDLAQGAGARRTRFEIRLDPDDLGRIDVRLDIAHDGRIATRLIVEKAETLDLLKQDSRELQRQLEQSGFQLGQSGLSFQLKDGRRDDWRTLADLNGLSAAAPEQGDEPAPAVEAYARAARRGGAGVDVTV